MGLTKIKLHPGLGAEVRGVDFARPPDTATTVELERLWREHHVLLFRGADIYDTETTGMSTELPGRTLTKLLPSPRWKYGWIAPAHISKLRHLPTHRRLTASILTYPPSNTASASRAFSRMAASRWRWITPTRALRARSSFARPMVIALVSRSSKGVRSKGSISRPRFFQ